MDEDTNSAAHKKLRKMKMARAGDINCARCPANRGENRKRRPRRSWKEKTGGSKHWDR